MKNMKKTLSLLLAAVMLTANAAAFTPELPENVIDSGSETEALPAEASDIVRFDAEKGELLYFNDFSGTVFSKSGFRYDIVNDGDYVTSNLVIAEPGEAYPFLTSNAGYANKNPFFISDTSRKTYGAPGRLTVTFKVYGNATANIGSFIRANKSDTYANWSFGGAAGYGQWKDYSIGWNLPDFDNFDVGTYNGDGDMRKFFFDDVALWYKPSNAVILMTADGKDGSIVTLTDSYTLGTPDGEGLGSAGQLWVTFDGTPYYPNTVYTASELGGKVLYPCDTPQSPAPESYSDTYGQLIYYNDFSGSDAVTNYANVVPLDVGNTVIRGGRYVAPADKTHSLIENDLGGELVSATGVGDPFTYTDGTPVKGSVIMLADVRNGNASSIRLFDISNYGGDGWGGYYTYWQGGSIAADSVATVKTNWLDGTRVTRLGFRASSTSVTNFAFCGMSLYVKNPTNALWIMKGGKREFVVVPGDTYTFPTDADKYISGTTVYAGGTTAAVSEVANKTFTAVSAAKVPAEYTEADGQLVWFDNFDPDGSGFTNIAAVGLATAGSNKTFDGWFVNDAGQSDMQPKTVGVEIKSAYPSEGTADNEKTVWKYTDGTTLTGKLTLKVEAYLNFSAVPQMYTVANNRKTADWGAYYTPWDNKSPAVKQWVSIKSSSVDTAKYSRFGLLTNKWETMYLRSVAVYLKNPTNAFWLTDADGNQREFVVIPDSGRFTLPTSIGETAVEMWTNGSLLLEAGVTYDAASLSGLAGSTLVPSEKAAEEVKPVSFSVNSVRTVKNKEGIRFAAYVSDEQRAAADEYGFIVALSNDTIENDASALRHNAAFDVKGTNSDGVRYTSGVCYDKKGTDLIYATNGGFLGLDKEGIYFTGVMVGIPQAYYATRIAARPYFVIGGNRFYGEIRTRSLYEVACAVKAGGYAGLDDEAKAYIDAVIAAVEQ